MKIVDTQVHLNRFGENWRDKSIEELLRAGVLAMDVVGVTAAVIDERWGAHILDDDRHVDHLLDGTHRYSFPLSELAVSRFPDRFAYLGRVDRRDPEILDVMRDLRGRPGCIATRIEPTPQIGELAPFDQGAYDDYFDAARRCGMPVFVRMTQSIGSIERYLKLFPDAQFILDHAGIVNPALPTWEERLGNAEVVLALARYPNLALKWCKAPTRMSMQPYPYTDVIPVLRSVIDAYGTDRVMWAGDASQTMLQHSWADALYYLRHAALLDETEKEWLLGRAAGKVLGWPVLG